MGFWKMQPISFARKSHFSFSVIFATSFPSTTISPDVGVSRPLTAWKSVDFPLPEGPISAHGAFVRRA